MVILWWYIGLFGIGIGALLIVTNEPDRSSFMGWPSETPSFPQFVGIVLVALSIIYLISGAIARSFQ